VILLALAALLFALYVFPTGSRRAGVPARSGRKWLPKDLHYHHYIADPRDRPVGYQNRARKCLPDNR
jgi:hypothetical protein